MTAAVSPELTGLSGWVVEVVDSLGVAGVSLLVALENLFPPIPSEVVLPVAGYLAGRGELGLVAVLVAATLGSVTGALLLYGIGAAYGQERLTRGVRWLPMMNAEDVDRSAEWFERYGSRAVLFGRCVPVVRSLVSLPAGMARMPLRRFIPLTLLGSAVWNTLFIVAGYELGSRWSDIGRYSNVLNAVVWALLALVTVRFVVRRLRKRRHEA